MKWSHAGKTDIGSVRPGNEDAFFVDGEHGVFLVADGMGGHAAGEVASRMVVEMVGPDMSRSVAQGLRGHELEERATALVREANRAVIERADSEPEKRGMGTTLTLLALVPTGSYCIAQVGDSRAYRLRDGGIEQLTRDHTVVQQQVEQGVLTNDEARMHPLSHVLTRALGTDPDIEPDTFRGEARPGDLYLLCSDGLSGMLSDARIHEIVSEHGEDPGTAVDALIEAAKSAGGQDNITAVLVKIEGISNND